MDEPQPGKPHPPGPQPKYGQHTLPTAAYELNDLLTIALANLERARATPDPAQRAKQLGRAETAIRHAGRLTTQLLAPTPDGANQGTPANLIGLLHPDEANCRVVHPPEARTHPPHASPSDLIRGSTPLQKLKP